MNKLETNNINSQVPYSPAALLNAFSNSLTSPLLNKPFEIKGIYKKGKGVNYNGVYYDILKDEFSDSNLTFVIPEKLRLDLKEGQVIEAQAYLAKRLSAITGRIDLFLTATDLLSQKERIFNEEEVQALEIIQQKAKIGYKDIDNLIKSKLYQQATINVTIIIGSTAVIDTDINHQLKGAALVFNIKYVKINLTRIAEIVLALEENDGSDILVVSRGGGENIQVFDNFAIAQQVLRLKSAFVTAIGHAVDEPLLQKIADKHFITPTALGQYFYDLYNRTLDEVNNSKAKLITDLTKQIELNFQSKIQDLTLRLEDASKTLNDARREADSKITNLMSSISKAKSTNIILVAMLVLSILMVILYFTIIR